MVDRKERNDLIAAIKAYTNKEINAFRFDDIIMDEMEPHDDTVHELIHLLWCTYSDFKDYEVDLNCWDFYQRTILLLESDAKLSVISNKTWNIRQLLAAISFGIYLYIALQIGWDFDLFKLLFPIGLTSILLHKWSQKSKERKYKEEMDKQPVKAETFPFASLSELRKTRSKVTKFKKDVLPYELKRKTYTAKQSSKSLLRKTLDMISENAYIILWAMFSPFMLVYQIFPDSEKTYRVIQ
ncbi:MAG: hypothetical protein ACIAQZ_14680 [Sedimentisphaeraceae bacterium JB056]